MTYVRWGVGNDAYGDTGLHITLLQVSRDGDAHQAQLLGVRKHAVERILQRTEHGTLEALTAALQVDWLLLV